MPAPSFASQPDALTLDDLEKRHILATLDALGGNKQAAADRLGISLRTLWNKLARYRGEVEPAEAVG